MYGVCRSAQSSQQRLLIFTPGALRGITRSYADSPSLEGREDVHPAASRLRSGTACAGRSVLLTGGTSGIGLAVAERLLLEGIERLVILSRDRKRGSDAVAKIEQSTGIKNLPISIVEVDVTDGPSLSSAAASAMKQMNCNTVIACAGMTQNKSILRLDEDEMTRIMSTNLTSNVRLGKLFLKHYHQLCLASSRTPDDGTQSHADTPLAPRSHVFIAVSSLLAAKGGEGASVYAASKAGLNAFIRTLCLEGSRIYKRASANKPAFRANVILPGYVDTPMLKDFADTYVDQLNAAIPLGRFAKPDEVADAVLFLLANEYANNTVLNLDGGLSAT